MKIDAHKEISCTSFKQKPSGYLALFSQRCNRGECQKEVLYNKYEKKLVQAPELVPTL